MFYSPATAHHHVKRSALTACCSARPIDDDDRPYDAEREGLRYGSAGLGGLGYGSGTRETSRGRSRGGCAGGMMDFLYTPKSMNGSQNFLVDLQPDTYGASSERGERRGARGESRNNAVARSVVL